MPNCVIVGWLHVFSWISVFLVAANCSFVAKGTRFLYIYNGNMFPSPCVSSLYCTIIMTLFDDVSWFAVITEWIVLKLMELIFTMSMLFFFLLVSFILFIVDLAFFLHSCTLLRNGSSYCTLCISCRMLGIIWLDGSNHSIFIFPCRHFNMCMWFYPICFWSSPAIFYFIKILHPH